MRQEAGAAADASGDKSLIEKAYAKWQGLDADERSPLGQAGVLRDMTDAIDGSPALHFVHVALPHRPWVLSRTGVGTSFSPELITDPDAPGYDFAARMEYQLHSMQVGAADTLVGELVDHLRATPAWSDTLLVVTSDHGTNLTPPDIGRMKVTDANREEVYRVPLFIKVPGQVEGEIRDDSVQNLDVLPSIVDVLGAEVDWEFDGHSLYDGSTAHTEPKVSTDVDAAIAIAERRREDFPYGDDWMALAAVGDNGDLVGTDVADLEIGDPSERRASARPGRPVRRPADRRRRVAVRARRNGDRRVVGTTRAGRRGERDDRRCGRRVPAQRRRLGVHRLRRRPLRRRSQRRGAVRGHPRRRRGHPASQRRSSRVIAAGSSQDASQWYRVRVPPARVSDDSTVNRDRRARSQFSRL